MKRATAVGVFALWMLGVLCALPASAAVVIHDRCTGTDHFPEQPVGNAPSKQVFALALDRLFAGQRASISITGASGNQTGTGTVADDGRVQVDVPLQQHGTHQVVAAGVGDQPIAPNDVVPNGTFAVNGTEQPCSPSQLRTAPAAAATTTTTAAPATTTTSRSTTTTTTTTTASATNAEPTNSDSSGSDRPIVFPILIAGGTVLVILGGTMVARSGRSGRSGRDGLGYAPSVGVDDKGKATPLVDAGEDEDPLGFAPSQPVGVDLHGRPERTPKPKPAPETPADEQARNRGRWPIEGGHAPIGTKPPDPPDPPKADPPKP